MIEPVPAAVPQVTRLAPSPTGALHLGNARTFLLNALLADASGWRVLLRVEDLETPRTKAGAEAQMLDELAWLGLKWEGPVVHQSQRQGQYLQALGELVQAGVAYPCVCTRRDIELAAAAPHLEDLAVGAYPGICRGRRDTGGRGAAESPYGVAWRVQVPQEAVVVHDHVAGRREFDLARTCGDFVVFKKNSEAAYQLAVVVDDAAAGVDAIVRGDDLLESAARQVWLRRLLGLRPEPAYWHLPLVIGADGRRLAKRHGDTRLDHYRARGASVQRMLGLLGWWSGLLERRRESDLEELRARFDPRRIPPEPVVFTPQDDAFLLGG